MRCNCRQAAPTAFPGAPLRHPSTRQPLHCGCKAARQPGWAAEPPHTPADSFDEPAAVHLAQSPALSTSQNAALLADIKQDGWVEEWDHDSSAEESQPDDEETDEDDSDEDLAGWDDDVSEDEDAAVTRSEAPLGFQQQSLFESDVLPGMAIPGTSAEPVEEHDAASHESNKYYQGLLTAADLDADPPGHRSGYVAIIGRPNAGKSTLMNSLVGQKLSIVSSKAQTTRHRILGIVSDDDSQVIMLDTPGVIVDKRNHLERRMMAAVKTSMRQADALVVIVDMTRSQLAVRDMINPPQGSDAAAPPMLVVLNKADLCTPQQVADTKKWWLENSRCSRVISISALNGSGVGTVHEWMKGSVPEGPTLYPKDLVSQHPEKFFVGEIIREHIFRNYRQELPYSVQVNVVQFMEIPGKKDYIEVEIVCEKDSHKHILKGSKSTAIKAVCTAARADIEAFLHRSVFLDTKIRVDTRWRHDRKKLQAFGY